MMIRSAQHQYEKKQTFFRWRQLKTYGLMEKLLKHERNKKEMVNLT